MVGLAALKGGVDWVDILAPQRAADISATFSPDLITKPQRGDVLNSWHLKAALELAKRATAVTIGNGITRRKETATFTTEFLKKSTLPVVVDADALHILADDLRLARKNMILTPHAHEFFVLTGKQPTTNLSERQGLVQRFAKKIGCTILLKGHIDIISNGTKTITNKTGHPLMTAAGTGDCLVGIAGALLARGAAPFLAAATAAWINGTAGEHAARLYGESFTTEALLENIHKAIA